MAKYQPPKFDETAVAQIRRANRAGEAIVAIARRLDSSPTTIRDIVHVRGAYADVDAAANCRTKCLSDSEAVELRALYADGVPVADLSDQFNVSRGTITNVAFGNGCYSGFEPLPRRRGGTETETETETKVTPGLVNVVRRAYYVDGRPSAEIGQRHGLSRMTVDAILCTDHPVAKTTPFRTKSWPKEAVEEAIADYVEYRDGSARGHEVMFPDYYGTNVVDRVRDELAIAHAAEMQVIKDLNEKLAAKAEHLSEERISVLDRAYRAERTIRVERVRYASAIDDLEAANKRLVKTEAEFDAWQERTTKVIFEAGNALAAEFDRATALEAKLEELGALYRKEADRAAGIDEAKAYFDAALKLAESDLSPAVRLLLDEARSMLDD